MLSFYRMKPEDRPAMEACLSKRVNSVCETSYATYFLWDEKYKFEICFEDGFMFTRILDNDDYYYLCPVGEGDFALAVEKLCIYCSENNSQLKFAYLTDTAVETLESRFPGQFEITPDRDSAEYIYLAERMISLQGKKLHSKRNFINRFKNEYDGRWSFERIGKENLPEVFAYENRWQRDNRTSEGDLEAEKIVITKLLMNMDYLGAVGGLLRLDGRVIGFSLGTKISDDTFDVQIEKADWDIPGAYQILNNEFAKAFCSDVTYINREEDLGLEGLRKAKLSYDPEKIVMKYNAVSKYVSCCVMDLRQPCGYRRG